MPTTTWATMRQDILRPLGLIATSTTTNITTNQNVDSTHLTDRFPVDDYFNNRWFIHITSGNNIGKIRRITDFQLANHRIVVTGAVLSSESGSVNFELSTFHPDDVKDAYNEAREIVFPDIATVVDIETIITGENQYTYTLPSTIRRVDRVYRGNRRNADSNNNLLLNADFEDWSSATSCDNWTLSGSGASFNQEAQTSNPENYLVLHGDNSGRLAVAGANTTLLQTFTPSSSSYTTLPTEGQEVNLAAWVYCNIASRVKLYIGSAAVGSFHGGTGWEYMKASETLDHNATTAVVGFHVTASNVAVYVDEIWMTMGQSEIMDVPYNELRNWDHVPPASGASDGGVIRFQEYIPDKYRIRIVGRNILTAASADTDTIEVDGELLHPLYDKTRQLLCLRMAAANPDNRWTEMARQFEESYIRSVEGNLVKVKSPPVAVPRMVF